MTTIRKIVTSKIDGSSADSTDTNEIRPFGEIAVYVNTEPNPDKLTLMMFDGTRTNLKSMVLAPGRLYGSDADSGDGNNRDTIKLIPDASLSDYTGNDQYLIIDPTSGEPGHIHIRAGGTQDASGADLYLGAEQTFVRVSDTYDNVAIRTSTVGEGITPHIWTFDNTGDLTVPGDIVFSGGGYIEDSETFFVATDGGFQIQTNKTAGQKTWDFDTDGNLTLPGNINYANGVNILSGVGSADFSNVSLIQSPGNLTIQTPQTDTATVTNENGNPGGPGTNTITGQSLYNSDIALIQPGWVVTGNNLANLTTVTSVVEDPAGTYTITTDTTEVEPFWYNDVYTFTNNVISYSNLVISSGNIIGGNSRINFVANSSGDGNGYSTIQIRPDAELYTDQYIIVDPTGGEPGHIHLRAGGTQDASGADLYLGGELTAVRVSDTSGIVTVRTTNIGDPNITMDWSFQPDGNLYFPGIGNNRIGESEPGLVVTSDNSVVLQANNSGNINEIKEWTFGADGNLTVPGNINFANGVNILSTVGAGSYGNTEVAAYLPTYTGNIGTARAQVTSSVDFMVGGFPYMGWQLTDSDTLKLRTNIASGDYTDDAVIVDRQTLEVNVVATLTAGNITTTNGVYWANGESFISSLESNAASQQTSIDTLLSRVDQAVNITSSPQFAGLTATANVEMTANVRIHQNLIVDGNINFVGNVTQNNITTANAVFTGDTYGFGALYAGVIGYTPLPYTVIQATADYNDYSQINFQNLNLSANASTEWVATAGNGTDLTNYIDFGIAGGAWNGTQLNSVGTAAKANDGWVYVLGNTAAGTGGNLVLGTIQPGKRVNILTGGPGSGNIYTYFDSTGVTTANVYATRYLYANGVSILTGVTGTYSNTNVASYLAGTVSIGNINLGTAVRLNGTTQTFDTTNGSSINIGSRTNFTGSAAGLGMTVNHPAQFASNVTVQGIGGISIPNRPAFRIYGGTPAWWTTANTNFKGTSIVVDYNQGNYFNSTTGVFTAPVTGLYQTTLNARIGSVNAQGQILVLKNALNTAGNAVMMWESDTNTGTAVHFGVSTVVKLNAGDFLTANITAGNIQFDQNDSWTVTYIG